MQPIISAVIALVISLGSVFLAGGVSHRAGATGGLTIPQGGTGWNAFQSGSIPYGGSSALRFATTSAGTNGQALFLFNQIPTWATASSSGSGTVTSIVAGAGLSGGTITTSGTLALKSYLATSTADTANYVSVFTSTNAVPATLGGYTTFTFNSTTNTLTTTNASTTNLSASQSLYAANASGTVRRVTGVHALIFTLASSTVWTGTSSATTAFGDGGTIYAPFKGTTESLQCGTNAGGLTVQVTANGLSIYLVASTTAGINPKALSFSVGQPITIQGGNPTASPTSTACTLLTAEN